MKVLDEQVLKVEYIRQGSKHLSLVIYSLGKWPYFLGRKLVYFVQEPSGEVNTLLDRYSDVFPHELGATCTY